MIGQLEGYLCDRDPNQLAEQLDCLADDDCPCGSYCELGVCGYAIAASDSPAFEERMDRDWWPELRIRYPLTPDANRVVQQIHRPARVDPVLARDYPAHMHANLLPRAKGKGFGGALVRTVLERLEKGVHVHVRHHNTHAIGFWEHLGFRVVGSAEKLVLGLRR